MRHQPVLKIVAVISTFYGVVLVLAPNALMAVYRNEPLNSIGIYVSMLFGGVLLGYAAIDWIAAEKESPATVRVILIGNLVATTIGFAASLYRVLTVDNRPMQWVNVVLYAVLTLLLFLCLRARESDMPLAKTPS
ncbi:MAG: hypothetical protein ACTHL1_00915 [Burkholderiaceae bacterium]